MKYLFVLVLIGLGWIGWEFHTTMLEVDKMKVADQELLDHAIIKYEPLKWRD